MSLAEEDTGQMEGPQGCHPRLINYPRRYMPVA